METALQILGAFVLLDLLAAVLLMALVAVVGRRQSQTTRVPLRVLAGALFFLALISAIIYGGLWALIRAAA